LLQPRLVSRESKIVNF